MIFCLSEINRTTNYLLDLINHSIVVEASTLFQWDFGKREKLLEFYTSLSEARMHAVSYDQVEWHKI